MSLDSSTFGTENYKLEANKSVFSTVCAVLHDRPVEQAGSNLKEKLIVVQRM